MPLINARELRRMYAGMGRQKCVTHLRESLQAKHLKPTDFSIRDLAESLIVDRQGDPIGEEFVRAMDPRKSDGDDMQTMLEAVDSAAFKNISGQLIYTTMLDEYEMYMAPVEKLYTNEPTRFNGEKIPGITGIGDEAEVVEELKPYPSVGVGEDYIETPETKKRGLKIEISKETLFFDRTNLITERARKVGEWLGLNKSKRIIDMVLGVTNNYKWKGTAYDTYQTTTPWDNVVASNGLANWSDIDAALQTFAGLTDPHTGEPIVVIPTAILVHTSLAATARYILNATQIRVDPNANAGTQQYQAYVPNNYMVPGNYEVISSPVIDARYTAGSVTTTNWYFGDFKRAFSYMENWPVQVVQMPANSYEEWNRDVVAGWKASERGVEAVRDPRRTQQNTA